MIHAPPRFAFASSVNMPIELLAAMSIECLAPLPAMTIHETNV